jgi:hypothetical protein
MTIEQPTGASEDEAIKHLKLKVLTEAEACPPGPGIPTVIG